MKLRLSPALQNLLRNAASDGSLSQDLCAAALEGAATGTAEWDVVKAAVAAARAQAGHKAVPPLEQLCRGAGIAFPERPKQAGKPPELQKRLDELRARLEQQQYDRMVADVTQHERKAKARQEGGLSTYRQQISFGVHVLAMMAAFYAFGHVAGMAMTSNRAAHPAIGLVFMVSALVLETVLFIIRTTVPPKLHQEAARRAAAVRIAKQQDKHKQELGLVAGSGSSAGSLRKHGDECRRQHLEPRAATAKPAGEKKDD